MLVSSTGGLLFVFNRNLSFLVLVLTIIFSLIYMRKGLKKSTYYSSCLAFMCVAGLFVINFMFAINPQSLIKYFFFGIVIFTTVLALFYFNNQDDKAVFIYNLYRNLSK